jgi:hypothetical protein
MTCHMMLLFFLNTDLLIPLCSALYCSVFFCSALYCSALVDRPRPNAEVVRVLLQAYPNGPLVRDATLSLPLNIALDRPSGAVQSVEVVRMLIDSYPDSIRELNPNGRMPLHSVLHAQSPDVGVVRYLAKQYPAAITQESKPGKHI